MPRWHDTARYVGPPRAGRHRLRPRSIEGAESALHPSISTGRACAVPASRTCRSAPASIPGPGLFAGHRYRFDAPGGSDRPPIAEIVPDGRHRHRPRASGKNDQALSIWTSTRPPSPMPVLHPSHRCRPSATSTSMTTAVTDAGLESLRRAPALESLSIKGTRVSQKAIKAFRVLRPKVNVYSGPSQPAEARDAFFGRKH